MTTGQRVLPTEGPPTADAGAVDNAKPESRRGWVLAVMCLGAFMVILDSAVVNKALTAIYRDLGAYTSTLKMEVNA